MKVRNLSTCLGLALLSAAASSSCGGEAQSDDNVGNLPAAEAPPATATPALVESAPPAPEPVARPAETPARAPASASERESRPSAPRPIRPAAPRSDAAASVPEEAVTPAPVEEVRALEAGRTLELHVEAEISTKAAVVGDEFTATVTDDVLGSAGEVVLPMGTQFKGHVTESRESTGSDQPAVLALQVESVTVNGSQRPLKATVVELDVKADARDSNTTSAAKVGAGAAVGALLGRIVGRDREGAVKGAVVGAAAGGAAAIATRSGHATVEPGARMVIRLDERLIVNR
jgi:hypothetical protein